MGPSFHPHPTLLGKNVYTDSALMKGAKVMESQSSQQSLALVPVHNTLDSLHTEMRKVQPPVQKKAK